MVALARCGGGVVVAYVLVHQDPWVVGEDDFVCGEAFLTKFGADTTMTRQTPIFSEKLGLWVWEKRRKVWWSGGFRRWRWPSKGSVGAGVGGAGVWAASLVVSFIASELGYEVRRRFACNSSPLQGQLIPTHTRLFIQTTWEKLLFFNITFHLL